MSLNNITAVYQIQSKIKPERIYIGSTIHARTRKNEHFIALKNGKHNPKLQNHYNKYGADDLVFTILTECHAKERLQIEQFFLDAMKPWFNICLIADTPIGYKHTKESIKKMKEFQSKRPPFSQETCDKISKALKGRIFSEDHCSKLSEAVKGDKHPMFGKKHPKSTTDKMSKALMGNTRWLGKKHKPETIEKMRIAAIKREASKKSKNS